MKVHALILSPFVAGSAAAQPAPSPGPSSAPPLLPPVQGTAIASEVSGARAMQTVRILSTSHRMRGSAGYRAAAELIRDRLQSYGLKEWRSCRCPPTARSSTAPSARGRPGTRASPSFGSRRRRLVARSPPGPTSRSALPRTASAAAPRPNWSISAPAPRRADYEGKDVRGKLVLTSSQPEAVADLAVGRSRRGRDRLLGAEPALRLVGRR